MMRKDFILPEEDVEHLHVLNLSWETVTESSTNIKRLVIYDYPVPQGYNVNRVALSLRIEKGYPDTPLDMVYFLPSLIRKDGKPIGAVTEQPFDGKTWQQWSRHRTNENPWRPGIDNIRTHLDLVNHWLGREFQKP